MQPVMLKRENLTPNGYNPNVVGDILFQTLKKDVEKQGILAPVLVRPDTAKGEGFYIIIDGEHRWKIANELDLPELPCLIKEIDENEAKIETISMNRLRGEFDQVKLAQVLSELRKVFSDDELEIRLGFSTVELQSYDELLHFDPSQFEQAEQETATEVANLEKDALSLNGTDFTLSGLTLHELDIIETCLKEIGGEKKDALTGLCKNFLLKTAPNIWQEVETRKSGLDKVDNNQPIQEGELVA